MGQEGGGGGTATVSFLSRLLDRGALGRSRKSSLSPKELFDQCRPQTCMLTICEASVASSPLCDLGRVTRPSYTSQF